MSVNCSSVGPTGLAIALLCGSLLLTLGCSNIRHTDTPRSAKEQLMLSASVERAWSQLDTAPFRGRAVFIESQFLECLDKGHALSALRERLCVHGAELADKADNADLILEVRCAAVGTDRQDDRIGTPALPIIGTDLAVPEINFAQATSQTGVARFAVFARHRQGGRHVYSSGPLDGRANVTQWSVMFLLNTSDADIAEYDHLPGGLTPSGQPSSTPKVGHTLPSDPPARPRPSQPNVPNPPNQPNAPSVPSQPNPPSSPNYSLAEPTTPMPTAPAAAPPMMPPMPVLRGEPAVSPAFVPAPAEPAAVAWVPTPPARVPTGSTPAAGPRVPTGSAPAAGPRVGYGSGPAPSASGAAAAGSRAPAASRAPAVGAVAPRPDTWASTAARPKAYRPTPPVVPTGPLRW